MVTHAVTHFAIPHQYVVHAAFVPQARPYRLKTAIRPQVELFLDVQALPEAGHHSVVVSARVTAKTPEDVEAYRVEGAVEAIVLAPLDVSKETLSEILRMDAGASVLGSVRALLTSLVQGTGFPALVLPPLSSAVMARLGSAKGPLGMSGEPPRLEQPAAQEG